MDDPSLNVATVQQLLVIKNPEVLKEAMEPSHHFFYQNQ